MSNLIDQNTELRKQLNDKNEQFYDDFLVYVRLRSFSKNEQQTEIMLINILQDILEAQQNGVSAQEYFGNEPKQIADELIKEIPNDWKNVVKLSIMTILAYLTVVFGLDYSMAIFHQNSLQTIDLGRYLICSLIAGGSVFLILWLIGRKYGGKTDWKYLFVIVLIVMLNMILFINIHTALILSVSRWQIFLFAVLLIGSSYFFNRYSG